MNHRTPIHRLRPDEPRHEPDVWSAAFTPLQRPAFQVFRNRKRRKRRAPVQGFKARIYSENPVPKSGAKAHALSRLAGLTRPSHAIELREAFGVRALQRRFPIASLFAWIFVLLSAIHAHPQAVNGDYFAHDPSTMIKNGNRYYVYRTSQGIMGKWSTDKLNWTYAGRVFPGNPPSWTTNSVPGFTGFFWAPDIVFMNGKYYLYYSVSSFGVQVSSIGLVTCTDLALGDWTDQGEVIHSTNGDPYNCIDPAILVDTNGAVWMTFGSFWNGIYLMELDPMTGQRITPTSPLTRLAYNSSIEASCLYQRGGYYYLFVNWGTCCNGIDSTYQIRVGRSTNVAGPYFDRNNVNMVNAGGTPFLEGTGRFIGPGHAGIMNENGTNWLTFHYYDGNQNGEAKLGVMRLYWTPDGWPTVTNDWSAFYTLEIDAREHRNQYNGSLKSGAAITNEPGRGKALNLDGASQYVLVSNSVANASTFAAWVKWRGGGDWQRIFDFGNGTSRYLFLSPRSGASGKLRFAITLNGNGNEQVIDAPDALPTNSWCHVAVSLDGTRGVLYLNGNSVGTNLNLTLRPWQVLARSNYLGRSQWPDPLFNGEIDSFRVFSRALGATEIRDVAQAHPALAHRYSFQTDATDTIGVAHGTLMGNAIVTNNALKLTGVSNDYARLPGGLVSGCAAVTLEFWATFGTNGNWARVFDFGTTTTPGTSGQQFLFFTPHTSSGSHRLGISAGGTVFDLDSPGTLDGRTVHVACIVDPANSYCAMYTNGVLDRAQTTALPALSTISPVLSYVGRSLFTNDAWLNATIAEFRIYDGRLTPEEIAANTAAGPDALALPIQLAVSNSASDLALTWPSYATGFNLESSPVLGPGAIWTPLTQSATLGNDRWKVTVPMTNNVRFYRLRK